MVDSYSTASQSFLQGTPAVAQLVQLDTGTLVHAPLPPLFFLLLSLSLCLCLSHCLCLPLSVSVSLSARVGCKKTLSLLHYLVK